MVELPGYTGRALAFLKDAKAKVGDVLEIKTRSGVVTGTLVPRYLHGEGDSVVLKLASGYNVGLSVDELQSASVKSKGEVPRFSPPPPPKGRKGLPKVVVLGTGGTIASRIDYRTGAVHPAVSTGELYSLIPELSEVAQVEPEIVTNVFSENIKPEHWTKVSKRVAKAVSEGASGVVITHGTDTLGYTAAALSFALAGIPIPVVLVGAQRSSDRPSSDAPLNLVAGIAFAARAEVSGVYVAMHLNESDEAVAFHRGTRVRKNHTSRRDAFRSIGVPLAAVWKDGEIEYVSKGLPQRGIDKKFKPKPRFEPRVAALKFYPSMPGTLIASARRAAPKGLVLEGTGLGHVSSEDTNEIRKLVKKGALVCMTSQCIDGRVDLNVYDTGRDLLRAGVLPLEDMLAETALAKLMWALANSESVSAARELMIRNLAGEVTTRTFLE